MIFSFDAALHHLSYCQAIIEKYYITEKIINNWHYSILFGIKNKYHLEKKLRIDKWTQHRWHWDKLVSLLETTHFMYKIIISCWRKMMAFISRLLKSLTQSYCKCWFVIGDDWSYTNQEVGCLSLIFLHVPLLIV